MDQLLGSTPVLYVGRGGKAKRSITDGARASCDWVYINGVVIDGHIIDSWAEVTLDGIGSTLNSRSNLQIASGIMSITGGAVCNSYRSRINFYSVVTVDGSDSAFNNIGDLYVNSINENGALIITNGGIVNNSNGYISYAQSPVFPPIPTCKVIVDGIGSSWNNSETLYVGCDTHGSLSITRGAVVSSDSGSIGSYPDSTYSPYSGTVTVDGAGSMWTNSSELKISNGTLSIKDAASVSCKYGYIGCSTTSTGKAIVDGDGSTWVSDGIIVGWKGNGILRISGGASVSDSIVATIGYVSGSTGEVTVDGTGSTWTSNALYVGCNGSGSLDITDGGLVSVAETLIIDQNGDGDSFINMATGGMLALHGDAHNSLGDFLGLISGTDAIRYWDYSISDWADIAGATYDEDYTLSYLDEDDLAGYTVLTASTPEPTMAGDANHDGVVDGADAAVLARYWLTTSGAFWGMGDFNNDGAVDEIDATLLAANWQSGVDEQTVPEPSAIVGLLVLGLAWLFSRAKMGRLRRI